MSGCLFEACRAFPSASGGAIYAFPCLWFSMNETSAVDCAADDFCGFCEVQVESIELHLLEIRDSSAIDCSCRKNTIELSTPILTPDTTTAVDCVNASLNSASNWGSALVTGNQNGPAIRFCLFEQNSPRNCLLFFGQMPGHDISCLELLNNSCQSTDEDPGLVHVTDRLDVTLRSCVIQSNTVDFILGTSAGFGAIVTFVNCVFDFDSFKITRSVSIATTNCIYGTQPTVLADCIEVESSEASPLSGTSASLPLVLVIALPVAGIAVAAAAVIIRLACAKKRELKVPLFSELSAEDITGGALFEMEDAMRRARDLERS
jgi:hypothetical protein